MAANHKKLESLVIKRPRPVRKLITVIGGLGLALLLVYGLTSSPQLVTGHGPHMGILQENKTKRQTAPAAGPVYASKGSVAYGIAAGGELLTYSQQELDGYFTGLKELGVTWLRWDMSWDAVQPSTNAAYTWAEADQIVDTSQRYGVALLPILTYTPSWARSTACKGTALCKPADPQLFGTFAQAAADRYKAKGVKAWEIWNEPNFDWFWGAKPNAREYLALLQAAYAGIKAADPQAAVLSGGLAAVGDEEAGGISPLQFIAGLYAEGGNKYFDGIALHPYSYPARPDYQADWNRWQHITQIRQLMIDKGDAAKKIWITEFGAPTNGPGQAFAANQLNGFHYGRDYMTEAAQQELYAKAVELCRQYADWMGPFFWYSLHDSGTAKDTSEHFFGMVRADGSKKPAYQVAKQAMQ